MATQIKVGDTVKSRGATDTPETVHYRVEALSDGNTYAWLKRIKPLGPASGSNYHTGITTVYEKVTPFFEADTIYERTLNDTPGHGIFIETFTVVRVEKNPDGRRVAFGRIVGSGYNRWGVRYERHYSYQAWRKVA